MNPIKNDTDYIKALETLKFLWENSFTFSDIKKKVALMEVIEEYETFKFKKLTNNS